MDPNAICGAEDKLLEELGLCAKGDICALRSFCQSSDTANVLTGSTSSPDSSKQERKRKLLAILQSGKKTRVKQKVAETNKEKKSNEATVCTAQVK
jgi:hypothetical protein